MFRRRRRGGEDEPVPEDWPAEDEAEESEPDEAEPAAAQEEPGSTAAVAAGPYDSAAAYPEQQRIDLGSLLIPVAEDQELQLTFADDQIVAAIVVTGDSALQVQAFAAPKSGQLWEEARGEIAEEIGRLGGQSREEQGPFGPEVHASMPAVPPGEQPPGEQPPAGRPAMQPARFIGVDGPRWLLRGTITGAAAASASLARPLEEVFAGIVVVRGDHPVPPRQMLEIRLPDDMREALEQEIAQAEQRRQYPSPFERGPEITETR